MDLLGYFASVFIGIALGLVGGGGSILTLPVLVYLFRVDVLLATAYSLFIVGVTSFIGSVSYFQKKLVNIKMVLVFGIPSIITVFITRVYLVPAIPQNIISINGFVVSKHIVVMLLFAVLMLFASFSMIKKDKACLSIKKQKLDPLIVLPQGLLVGVVTGFVGAGGGFLIIPALVNFLKLDIKTAIGTSLLIIALNSLFGFAISATQLTIDWMFLFKVLMLAVLGVFIGSFLSSKIEGSKLKPIFGWFVLVMGIYIILKEINIH